MASELILCLDSGTTSVKAAIFDQSGQVLARAERPNSALERAGNRVEQDMAQTLAEAERVAATCLEAVPGGSVAAVALTGQGDGLWPLAADLSPAGKAMTWLDGRAAGLPTAMPEALDAVERITAARPTAASQTLQLLWLQDNDPARFARIRHALRLKEWLFFGLTGVLRGEPGSLLPVWGDWRSGRPRAEVAAALGLKKGLELLPELGAVGDCVAGLSDAAAARIGLPAGLPVVLGPGDVQSSLVGLGVGPGLSLDRASIFGTSAIHGRFYAGAEQIPRKLSGAMIQQFATGQGFVCFHPCFNGGTAFRHVDRLVGGKLDRPSRPAWSGVILHPFFEPGGERAPITHPHASAALFGMSATTTPDEIAWAAREALAFLARMSHADLGGAGPQGVAVGGGVARDAAFLQLLASVLDRPLHPHSEGDTALRGLAAVAMGALETGRSAGQVKQVYIAPAGREIAPETGAPRSYLDQKFALFQRLLADAAGHWDALARIRAEAGRLNGT